MALREVEALRTRRGPAREAGSPHPQCPTILYSVQLTQDFCSVHVLFTLHSILLYATLFCDPVLCRAGDGHSRRASLVRELDAEAGTARRARRRRLRRSLLTRSESVPLELISRFEAQLVDNSNLIALATFC